MIMILMVGYQIRVIGCKIIFIFIILTQRKSFHIEIQAEEYARIENVRENLHEPRHDKTNKMSVRPAKTQISLGIRPVWSESSLSAWKNLGSLATHWVHSEDSDQTGRMPRFIWVFAGRTLILFVCHVVAQIKSVFTQPKCYVTLEGKTNLREYLRIGLFEMNSFFRSWF